MAANVMMLTAKQVNMVKNLAKHTVGKQIDLKLMTVRPNIDVFVQRL